MTRAKQDEVRDCIRLLNWCAEHHVLNETQKAHLDVIVRDLETGRLAPPVRASQWRSLFEKMGVKGTELWPHRKILLSYFSEAEQRYFRSLQKIQSRKLKSGLY